jgi:hypothetical protein
MSFEKVFTQGTLIDINIRVWRAQINLEGKELISSNRNISTQIDLSVYDLGKKLSPPEEIIKEFNSIENKAHLTLIKNSNSFAFGDARIVPEKCLENFIHQFDELKDQFNQLKEDFISKYGIQRDNIRSQLTEAVEIAYSNALFICDNKLDMTEKEYTIRYIENFEKKYPTPENLANKFRMEYKVFDIKDITQQYR